MRSWAQDDGAIQRRDLVHRISEILERSRGDGSHQIFVSQGPEVLYDQAVGTTGGGDQMTSGLVHHLYCATKPILAMVLARLLEDRGLSEDSLVSEILPAGGRDFSVGDLLLHRVGLAMPDAFTYQTLPSSDRMTLTDQRILALATPGEDSYSEVAAWLLIQSLIRALATEESDAVCDRWLTKSMGLSELWFAEDEGREEIGFYYDGVSGLPLLHDRTDAFRSRHRQFKAWGFASARGLGYWYQKVSAVLRGEPTAGLPSPAALRRWTERRSSWIEESGLGRVVSFCLGFCYMREYGFDQSLSERAIGQSGFLGNSFGLLDPRRDLVVSFVAPCLTISRGSLDDERRRILDTVLHSIG